jgi:hypothetical protein
MSSRSAHLSWKLAMIERRQLSTMTLDEVADVKAGSTATSSNDQAADAEFIRRQTQAAIDAAQAAMDTAKYTRRNARYMLWSVIVLAASSIVSTGVALIQTFTR